uniref:SAP domain-containing protein n=1 Tax=Oryza meridionalis TaxID=40149 RepID=A0A0E0F9W3_9ORYZ
MEMDFESMKRRELQALCKRHGLSAGGSNAALVARLAATLSGAATEEKVVGVVVGKGCMKRSGDGSEGFGAAKTVTFALEEEEEEMETRGRGRRGRRPRVMWSPVAAKSRGRQKAGEMVTDSGAGRGGWGKQPRGDRVGGDAAAEEEEPAADAPRRRSRRNVVNSSDADGAEGDGVKVGEAVDNKRKQMQKQKQVAGDVGEEITVSVQDGVSGRSTRSSCLLTAVTVVQSPVVEKKRGRKRKGDVDEQICLEVQEHCAEVQDDGRKVRSGSMTVTTVSPPVVECRRSRRKAEDPIVEKAAKVNVSTRSTISSSVVASIASPIVLENKRQKKERVHLDVELPTVPVVQANVAPSTRSLRNRVVQVKDSVMMETEVCKKLENKRQSCRPSTQYQQSAFVEEEDEQMVHDPSMSPKLRRSSRRQSVANELLLINLISESNNANRAQTDAKGLKTAQPLMHNAAKTSMKNVVVRKDENAGLTKRNTGRGRDKIAKSVGKVSLSENSGEALPTEMQLEVIEPLRRSRRKSVVSTLLEEGTKCMHGSVRGDVLVKQPTEKRPVRRSTRKSVVSAMLEKESNGLTTEIMPETHIRISKRKSFLPNMLNGEKMDDCEMVRNEELKHFKGNDPGKKLAIKEPARRSTRKSVVPAMFDRETKGLAAEMNPEVHVRRSTRKSVVPNMPNNDNKYHDELVRTVVGVAAAKQLEAKKPVRSNEGGFKLGKRRRTSMEMSCSSGNNTKVSDRQKSRKQQKVHTPASKGPCAKESRTDALQEIISFEESNADADDMVRGSTQDGDEGCHEQWVNSEVHGSDSSDAAHEYVDFRTESIIHLSGISSEELGQSSSITELVSRAGISSENKVLLDDAEADLGAAVAQTLNANSNEEVLGDLDNPAAIAEELSSATALPLLDAEDHTDKNEIITIPEQLLGALSKLSSVDQLPPCTSDADALVIVNDSHACNIANWTAVKGTEDIQNVDIALSDDGLEASKSMTVAEEVLSCAVATVLEHGTLAEHDFERTCMKNGDASLSLFDSGSPGNETDNGSFKALEFELNYLPTVNDERGKQAEEDKCPEVHSDAASEKSNQGDDLCKNLSTVKGESPLASNFHVEDAAEHGSMLQIEINAERGSSDGMDSSFGLKSLFAEEGNQQRYLIDDGNIAAEVDSGNKLSDERHSSLGLKSLFAEEGNQQHNLIDDENIAAKVDSGSKSSDGRHSSFRLKSLFAEESNQQCNLIDDENIVVKVDSGSNSSDGRHSSFGLKSLFAEESNQQCNLIHDENIAVKIDSGSNSSDGRHSSFGLKSLFAEEGNQQCNLVDDENIAVKVDSGSNSSDGRHSSFGLNSLFAEESNQQCNLIHDENVAVKVDSGNKSIGFKTSTFYTRVDCDLEDAAAQLIGEGDNALDVEQGVAYDKIMLSPLNDIGACSSYGRNPSIGQRSLYAQERGGSNVTNAAFVAAETDGKKDLDNITVGPHMESDGIHTEMDVGLVSDNPENKLALEPVQQGDAEEGKFEKPSPGSAIPDCKHQQALVNEVVMHSVENKTGSSTAEQSSSSPQSMSLQESMEETMGYVSLAFAGGNSDAVLSSSVIVPANDNDVHVSSNISQLESTDCLDEPTLFFNMGVHQGPNEKCNKRMEDQVPSGVSTIDISVPATANSLESGLTLLPANETSNLQDDQLNTELESTQVGQSGISCAENSTNILELGTVNVVDKGSPCDHSLPKDCPMDHYQQHEGLNDIPADKSLEASDMYLGNSVFRIEGILEKPAINLATPDCKLQGTLLEFSLKNDAETPNSKHSPFGLQSLFSEENMDGSGAQDNAGFPCAENKVDESNNSHGKCRVEKPVSAEPVRCEGSHDNLGIVKEIGSCVSSCQQVNEQEEFSEASHKKRWVAPIQLDLADDVNQTEREIISSELVCEKEEKMEVMSSDIDIPVRESHGTTHASPVSKPQICDPKSSQIFDDAHPSSNPSQLELPDVFHQDHEVLCSERNDQILPGIPSSPFSEAVSIKIPENETMLLEAAETSELLDEKLNPQPGCDELAEHDLSGVKDTEDSSDTEFMRYSIFRFPADGQIDSCQEMELPNDQSATKAREESAFSEGDSVVGTCETNEQRCQVDSKEENNEHKADQVAPCIPTFDMSGAASTKGSEGGITLLPDAKLPVFTDVQLNSKLDGEHNLSGGKDTGNIFDNRSVDDSYHEQELLNDLSAPKSLEEPCNACMDSCNGQTIPEDTPGPKSPEDYQDDSVSGSVGDMFEPSPTERAEHETTLVSPAEMLVFKFGQHNNPNLVSVGGHNHSCDEDSAYMFSTEPVASNNQHEQELPNDVSAPVSLKESAICQEDISVHTESCPGKSLPVPEDISAPKSPEECTIHQDDSVPRSAVLCQTSGRRRINEISTKLTVKPSHIAMNAPSTKQVDNLSESAIALLRNRENTLAIKTDHPVKPNPDRSVAKNSSRRPLQPIGRRPEGH